MTAVISLLIVVSLSLLITRIGTIAIIHTGLSKDIAQFQVRSAYLGVGFTTNEAESAINNPVRRKIITYLMFLGNAGIITTVSSVIFSFISLEEAGFLSFEVLVLCSGAILLMVLSRSKFIDRKLSGIVNAALDRFTDLDVYDYYSLLGLEGDYTILRIKISNENWMADKSLDELKLDAEGVRVLGIYRKGKKFIGAPDGGTEVNDKDILLLYGRTSTLNSLKDRKKGRSGESEHERAKEEQEEVEKEQQFEEKSH